MLQALNKVFVRAFYKANAGFFLFFFFVFFGAVQGGSLLSYHLSLMKSILGSTTILCLVLCCWTAYHLKCTSFFLKAINAEEGSFLYNLQALGQGRQWRLYVMLYSAVYAPVLLYATTVCVIGWQRAYVFPCILILLYQILSVAGAAGIIHHRINNWLRNFHLPSFSLPVKKTFLLFVLYHFTAEKKNVLLLIKAFSLLLLYVALVWNKGPFSNDSFILFYLLMVAAHALLPYLSVQFTERRLAFSRNLPLPLFKRAMAYVLPYALLVLPEALYLFVVPNGMPAFARIAYVANLAASLFLLTAIQYSEAQNRDEYVKATGGLLFISIFVFHVQAFWIWTAVQLLIGLVLFVSGYYKFETEEE